MNWRFYKLFLFQIAFFALIACVYSAPSPKAKPSVFAAPFVAAAPAAYVTATSSQVIARNYNGLAAPLVAAAPYVAAPAPIVSPYAAYAAAPAFAPAFAPYAAAPYAAAPFVL